MDWLGGLIHRLPVTSACFLVGAAAISALPPLNGFVSEWLLFQAVLVSPGLPRASCGSSRRPSAPDGVGGGPQPPAFVRAYGITFLGRPQRGRPRRARGGRLSSRRC